jgi:hypothetical protein
VLLVVRAQPAIERAAVADLGLELERDRARLVEPLDVDVHLGVAIQQRLERLVHAAPFAQPHTLSSRTLITALHTGQMLLVYSKNTSSRSKR